MKKRFYLHHRVNSQITEKTDCYSFAIFMLEMITSLMPWKNHAPHQITMLVAVKVIFFLNYFINHLNFANEYILETKTSYTTSCS